MGSLKLPLRSRRHTAPTSGLAAKAEETAAILLLCLTGTGTLNNTSKYDRGRVNIAYKADSPFLATLALGMVHQQPCLRKASFSAREEVGDTCRTAHRAHVR